MLPHLVSVIIPWYNHGKYLEKAIESVLSQSYQHFEIVVVDDGSTDETREVAQKFETVKYIRQSNQGLSAARNIGIDKSAGRFLVFLDADDWLAPDALFINLTYIEQNPEIAFVAGSYNFYYQQENTSSIIQKELLENHYCHLLKSNFIGMHAVVMFQNWVFDLFRYDATLNCCEDYDLYFKITRKYRIIFHTKLIAIYNIHDNNMSSNYILMLENALIVLNRQKKLLISKTEEKWFKKGVIFWKSHYSRKIYDRLIYQSYNKNQKFNKVDIADLKHYNSYLYLKLVFYIKIKRRIRALIKQEKIVKIHDNSNLVCQE